MVILLAKDSKYTIGSDFPLFNIPFDMDGATSTSLSDFQWWAYSSDFQAWLKANPREWTADSEDMSKYGSLENFIKENFNNTIEISGLSEEVLDYDNYHSLQLLEKKDDTEKNDEYIKFHYAYNRLINDGKIEDEFVTELQKVGENKAVFVNLKDPESGDEVDESLCALKISAISTSGNSKLVLFNFTERLPGGPVEESTTVSEVMEDISNMAIAVGGLVAGAAGLFAAYHILSIPFKFFLVRKAYNTLANLRPGQTLPASNTTKFAKWIAGGGKKAAGFIGRYTNPKQALDFYKGTGKAIARGTKGAIKAATKGKVGVKGAMSAFAKGTGRGLSKVGLKGASRFVPVVGWTLAAVDVVGSLWNWYSDKQAPKYSEVDDFAKGQFSPKSIPVGVPITICWSQEAGGAWGTIVNFVANNDTRTTMELIKLGDFKGKSIFMVSQINSKELNKQLSENDLVLIAFNTSEVVKRGILDNDDLDFEILSIKDMSPYVSTLNFKGVCNWDELLNTYKNSSSSLIISDSDAPKRYNFYFEDSEGEKINVKGSLVTDDDLDKMSQSEIANLFSFGEIKNPNESDLIGFEWDRNLLESSEILSFNSFNDKAFGLNEDEKVEGDENYNLTPAQKMGPKKVAIYIVTEKDYANPEYRDKYETGKFTNFLVNPDDWDAKDGDKIEVYPNTTESLENPIKGTYVYKPDEDEEEESASTGQKVTSTTDTGGEQEEETGDKIPDDYYITVDPDDIKIKQRDRSTAIIDRSFKDGINLFDEFLTPRKKEILGIDNWKTITFAKEFYDRRGDVIEVKLKNKYASLGNKTKRYKVTDGESFEIAKKFVEETKDRIKYE